MTTPKLVIFIDLDETLLDRNTYSFDISQEERSPVTRDPFNDSKFGHYRGDWASSLE